MPTRYFLARNGRIYANDDPKRPPGRLIQIGEQVRPEQLEPFGPDVALNMRRFLEERRAKAEAKARPKKEEEEEPKPEVKAVESAPEDKAVKGPAEVKEKKD